LGMAYARARADVGRVAIVAGARGDFWRATPRDASLPVHRAALFSPRLSAALPLAAGVALETAGYIAYRVPTLNELYCGFRAGNVVTNPNPALDPERLAGVEAGLAWSPARASARITAFYTRLEHAITNVTLSSTPTLITRERRNEDELRAAGIEAELSWRPAPFGITAFGAYTRSRFWHTPEQPDLEGLRVPQVPEWQGGGAVTWNEPRVVEARV